MKKIAVPDYSDSGAATSLPPCNARRSELELVAETKQVFAPVTGLNHGTVGAPPDELVVGLVGRFSPSELEVELVFALL